MKFNKDHILQTSAHYTSSSKCKWTWLLSSQKLQKQMRSSKTFAPFSFCYFKTSGLSLACIKRASSRMVWLVGNDTSNSQKQQGLIYNGVKFAAVVNSSSKHLNMINYTYLSRRKLEGCFQKQTYIMLHFYLLSPFPVRMDFSLGIIWIRTTIPYWNIIEPCNKWFRADCQVSVLSLPGSFRQQPTFCLGFDAAYTLHFEVWVVRFIHICCLIFN